jgi:fructokinase
MQALGLNMEMVQTTAERPTGAAIIATDAHGNASFSIERPAAFDCLHVDEVFFERVQNLRADWIYFGTLAAVHPPTEEILQQLLNCAPQAKRFYDMNLREGHWNLALVERLSGLADVLKLNETEAELLFALRFGKRPFQLEDFCRDWAAEFSIQTICVTLGSKGCAVFQKNLLQSFSGVSVQVIDTVGAGDAFAAAFLHHLHLGHSLEQAARAANALGALVASRAGATPHWRIDELQQIIESGANSFALPAPDRGEEKIAPDRF